MNDKVTEKIEENLDVYVKSFSNIETSLESLFTTVSDDIEFKDPFNHVFNKEQFKKVMQHFVENSEHAKFDVKPYHVNYNEKGATTFLHWTFKAKIKIIGDWQFDGVSLVHVNEDGLICKHIDFWDSGEHFYKRIPVIGYFIKKIINRVKIHE